MCFSFKRAKGAPMKAKKMRCAKEQAPSTPKPTFESLIQMQHTDGYWDKSAEPILRNFFVGEVINDKDVES